MSVNFLAVLSSVSNCIVAEDETAKADRSDDSVTQSYICTYVRTCMCVHKL